MQVTPAETKAYKTVVAFVGGALTYTSTLTLHHPLDYVVGALLFAGTVAGVWRVPNPPKS